MTEETKMTTQDAEDAALAAPSDDENPALIDAHKTFVITLIGSALFGSSVRKTPYQSSTVIVISVFRQCSSNER